MKKILFLLMKLFNKKSKENIIENKEPIIVIEESATTIENTEVEIIEYIEEKMEENKELILILKRCFKNEKYTIGHLYIGDNYFCDTIEDTDRGLYNEMGENEIKSKKVYGETAIPYGEYEITMNVKSSKYSNFEKYKWAKPYEGYLPRLLNVKGFDGVLIHVGNTQADTYGCVLVGENKEKGKVLNSTQTFHKLMNEYLLPAKDKNYNIKIKITS